ncbi:hypothetical protein TNCV_4432591 [Trichonephila clavipes]|nr:hypothetical protein TNCV_4432591 [Trichonephila clavipes]
MVQQPMRTEAYCAYLSLRVLRRCGSCADGSVKTVGSLLVRASDSRPKDLGSMPDATKYPPTTYRVHVR